MISESKLVEDQFVNQFTAVLPQCCLHLIAVLVLSGVRSGFDCVSLTVSVDSCVFQSDVLTANWPISCQLYKYYLAVLELLVRSV